MSDTITVYSDYVCPFCYLGRESLRRYQQERAEPLEIEWRPFDLRSRKRRPDGSIDHSVEDGKDEEYSGGSRRRPVPMELEPGSEVNLNEVYPGSDMDSGPEKPSSPGSQPEAGADTEPTPTTAPVMLRLM